jgi:ubiquinone/menaquinone biosynthesis C-methylase UbiE
VGVDVSEAALESAANIHSELETIQADASDLPCIENGSFDIYVSLRTYQSTLFDIETSVLEATRILKPGGIFVVSLSDAHRVGTGIVRGILEPDSRQVDFDHPYFLAENVRRTLTSLGFSGIGVRTGLFEVYVFGKRPG